MKTSMQHNDNHNSATHQPWCEGHEPVLDQCVSVALDAADQRCNVWLIQGRDDTEPRIVIDTASDLALSLHEAGDLFDNIQILRNAAITDAPVQR